MVSVWQILDLINDFVSKLEKGNVSKWTKFHLIFSFVNEVFVQQFQPLFGTFARTSLDMQKHNVANNYREISLCPKRYLAYYNRDCL
jgi:hypothetical protein